MLKYSTNPGFPQLNQCHKYTTLGMLRHKTCADFLHLHEAENLFKD